MIRQCRLTIVCINILLSGESCSRNATQKLPWCLPVTYDKKKPPILFNDDEGSKMNLHFTFSVREVSKVTDSEQTLKIPMYFTVSWTDERLSVEQQHKAWSQSTTGWHIAFKHYKETAGLYVGL